MDTYSKLLGMIKDMRRERRLKGTTCLSDEEYNNEEQRWKR